MDCRFTEEGLHHVFRHLNFAYEVAGICVLLLQLQVSCLNALYPVLCSILLPLFNIPLGIRGNHLKHPKLNRPQFPHHTEMSSSKYHYTTLDSFSNPQRWPPTGVKPEGGAERTGIFRSAPSAEWERTGVDDIPEGKLLKAAVCGCLARVKRIEFTCVLVVSIKSGKPRTYDVIKAK
jgi:hypothetical protein